MNVSKNAFLEAYANTLREDALRKLRAGEGCFLTPEEKVAMQRLHEQGWSTSHPNYHPYTNVFGDGFGY